jgi:peptide chain release factor 2
MEQQVAKLNELQREVISAWNQLRLDGVSEELKTLGDRMESPEFWQDPERAQIDAKRHSNLEKQFSPWQRLRNGVNDMIELAATNDPSLEGEITVQLAQLQEEFASLKDELKFSGPYDDHDVIMSIYAGAGGTDAQDWAQMLLRMYIRWAERHNYTVRIIDESAGDEAGIKSVTLELTGRLMFGLLKGEHGVHRLVRLSPFNADSLRQTSFAKVDILPKIDQSTEVELDDKDLRIDVYRAGGHGGQSVNTTDSAVRVTHLPTGITVAIQNERSQLQNKETALTILRSRLAQLQIEQHAERVSELKGPNEQAAWGNQIRNYVLHPYKQVKDLRSRYETSDVDDVLDGGLDTLLNAYLEYAIGDKIN